MNENQAIEMDKKIFGPRLFCQLCGERKVTSPCYSCQYYAKGHKIRKVYCRGCRHHFKLAPLYFDGPIIKNYNYNASINICNSEYEVCKALQNKN